MSSFFFFSLGGKCSPDRNIEKEKKKKNSLPKIFNLLLSLPSLSLSLSLLHFLFFLKNPCVFFLIIGINLFCMCSCSQRATFLCCMWYSFVFQMCVYLAMTSSNCLNLRGKCNFFVILFFLLFF